MRKCLERSDVSPGTRTHRRREEDTERGEAEAALALLGGLAPVEDTTPALGVLCEVAVCGGGRRFRKRCDGKNSLVVVTVVTAVGVASAGRVVAVAATDAGDRGEGGDESSIWRGTGLGGCGLLDSDPYPYPY